MDLWRPSRDAMVTNAPASPANERRPLRPPRLARGALAALLAIVVAVLAAGCFSITDPASSQAPLGDVRLEFRICADGSPGCPGEGPAIGQPVQLLIGVMLPAGVDPAGPPELVDLAGVSAAFDQAYTDQLNADPANAPDAGMRWMGYITPIADIGEASLVRVTVPLPPGADGAPYAGPLPWGAAVGYRVAGEPLPASRPVDCTRVTAAAGPAPAPDATFDTPEELREALTGRDTECVTSSVRDQSAATIDLALSAGPPASGRAGETVDVAFRAKQAAGGQPVDATYALGAATDLPRATARPSAAALTVTGDGTAEPGVAVTIPEGTPAGTYRVELTATAEGHARTASAVLRVLPPREPETSGEAGPAPPAPPAPPPPPVDCDRPFLPTLGPWVVRPERDYPGYRLVKTGPKNPVGHGGWLAVDPCFSAEG
jgi:hypothetical protein